MAQIMYDGSMGSGRIQCAMTEQKCAVKRDGLLPPPCSLELDSCDQSCMMDLGYRVAYVSMIVGVTDYSTQ